MTEGYQVRLEVFEGPLDLLLHLIDRQELDITAVSLSRITNQYLSYLNLLDELDPGAMSDFLFMAARLLLIKSRALLPRPDLSGAPEDEDPAELLAMQLREYRRFKEAARLLAEREALGLRAYVRTAPTPSVPRQVDLAGLTLDDLMAALTQALASRPRPRTDPSLEPYSISIADKIEEIRGLLATQGRVSFQQMLAAARSRLEIIVAFLALLELIKGREVAARQDEPFGEIWISRREDGATTQAQP